MTLAKLLTIYPDDVGIEFACQLPPIHQIKSLNQKTKLFYRAVNRLLGVLEHLRENNLWDQFHNLEDQYFITGNGFRSISIERRADSLKFKWPAEKRGILVHNHPGCEVVWPSAKDIETCTRWPSYFYAVVGSTWNVAFYDSKGMYCLVLNGITFAVAQRSFLRFDISSPLSTKEIGEEV